MKKFASIISFILVFSIAFSSFSVAYAADGKPEMIEYGFVNCGDAKIEYGIYGLENGEPLLLLPPNNGDMHSFDGSILPEMSKHFKVITVSPRGTGNSDWVEGTMTFENMSDDLAKLLDYLKIEKTNIFGFSDGGNLGFVFTLAYSERVTSLAVMGSNINTMGTKTVNQICIVWKYICLCVQAFFTDKTEDKIRRDIQGMMVGQPSLTYEDISQIKVPVLNIYSEHDMIKRSHSQKITESIENAQDLMLVGAEHGGFEYTDTIINPALKAFYGVK